MIRRSAAAGAQSLLSPRELELARTRQSLKEGEEIRLPPPAPRWSGPDRLGATGSLDPTLVVMVDDRRQRGEAAIVHVGRADRHVAERWRLVGVLKLRRRLEEGAPAQVGLLG